MRTSHRRVACAAAALLAAAQRSAAAHSVAVCLSTPVSPPAGFEWVFFVGMALILGANVAVLRRSYSADWFWAPARAAAPAAFGERGSQAVRGSPPAERASIKVRKPVPVPSVPH